MGDRHPPQALSRSVKRSDPSAFFVIYAKPGHRLGIGGLSASVNVEHGEIVLYRQYSHNQLDA